ncbi:MAG: D-alanyl-D-alanine carboxypeptidase, partial [Rubrivivax sp.]|nr:D-alanyl-D-alanine carboxypeptidase [Rubrivivax sp.]
MFQVFSAVRRVFFKVTGDGGGATLAGLLLGLGLSASAPAAQQLPPEAAQALQRAGIPADALSVVVHDLYSSRSALRWQEQRSVNPASLAKLLTTLAALDRLGPAWAWSTPVWLAGPVKDGVLDGSLHIKG